MTIEQIEQYLNSVELPKSVQLNKWIKITDVKEFIEIELLRYKNTTPALRIINFQNLEQLVNVLKNENTKLHI